jgi:diguanylate cyclase (GGDEF)-like protein
MIPGLNSYRGRYAYVSLVACFVLLCIAYLSWSQFSQATDSQISVISQRSTTAGLLLDTQSHLNLLENYLQRIVIDPHPDDISAVRLTYQELNQCLHELHDFLGSDIHNVIQSLLSDSQLLGDEMERLLMVRQDAERWFPAMDLLQNEMYPTNKAMLGEFQSLLQESKTALTAEQRLVVIEEMMSLRRAWFGMVGKIHHFMLYRFGGFVGNTADESLEASERVDYFASRVTEHIATLRQIYSDARSGMGADERMDRLQVYNQRWQRATHQLFVLMESQGWRRDLQLMRENMTPIFSNMRNSLSLIGLKHDKDSVSDITHLTGTARKHSESILGLAMMGMLMILAAYLYINRTLLKPIAQTAQALKEEARGAVEVHPPPAHLRETRDLVEAFSEMRRQVHQRQRYLDHIAHHDALTQLPNRALFHDRLEHALAIALRGETQVGLMFLDLDEFKRINDTLGHLVGDELLRTVADRLVSLVRNSDTVARLGGDEFAILVEGINQREDMLVLAEKILRVVEQPMVLDGQKLQITVSIGIATAPHDDISAEYLIRDADAAMYEAKRQGRAAYSFFSGELTSRATEVLLLENQVRQAVEQGEYAFYYQPVITGTTGDLFCFEALMRWNHPSRGILYPDEFLSVLDQTGAITAVTEPLVEQAIAFQKSQHLQHGRKVAIAINLSVRLLNDIGFRKMILDRLIVRDFMSDSLILEITEDILMQDLAEAEIFLQQARALGARIAMDDFGTGQSSLSHLRQFPFDFLKIDREFIRNVDTDSNDASLVEAIIQLAHALKIQVIAEGVESESQLTFLQSLGCDYLQGYLIGLPNNAEDLLELSALGLSFKTDIT